MIAADPSPATAQRASTRRGRASEAKSGEDAELVQGVVELARIAEDLAGVGGQELVPAVADRSLAALERAEELGGANGPPIQVKAALDPGAMLPAVCPPRGEAT